MKLKRRFLWTLLLALPVAISISGCKKFLDRKPLQSTLDDLNQGALEGQIFAIYNILRTTSGFSELVWLDFHSIRDDDAQKGSDANDGKEIVTEFETFQYAKDDWAPNTYWNDHYSMINAANNALHTADSLKVNDPASLRNVGEALFFRAYAYFELVKTYGEVPLINYKIVNPSDGIRAKSSVATLYAFIDSNLTAAVALLPLRSEEYGNGFDGRVTRGSANTLWAQSYLFRGDWGRVSGLCKEIIASNVYTLSPNFEDIWKDGVNGVGKNGPESIFETQANVGQNGQSNSKVDNGNQWGTCQQVRRNGAPVEWNLGWGWNTPTDNLESAWDNADPRKRKTILYSGQSDGGPAQGGYGATLPAYTNPDGAGGLAQKYWNKKVYSDPSMRSFTGMINNNGAARWINHRIFRYADVILMLAEAANEMNDGPTAEANLELIRNRASGNLGATRTVVPKILFTTKEAMRTAIKAERRFEFAMEGYRFYDLVRWGDAQSVLGGLGYTSRCRYYPIPQKAIDLSGGVLKQNPEW
ncbi:RagB/SusD family nutrient uptake outer membrane protein [Terrimonas sp. NA20]|uniref:RagB/SusD family nutrient uptake outer membrane protein n=1 Tax=Terrimonas ginsenosidimutans TaxID=2908004 RepID=A0ABS9KUV1_9BACT|nr:RagB/SusD family nutrient uptake outer membrane protein [Terrimonas ginsenosidimutans]MCG2616122.1 RagB/SusD family nutrient uptake outer membrane protein [Terrimonas ginsenosidimutans]